MKEPESEACSDDNSPGPAPMMVVAGQTAHYVVSYDDSLSNGLVLANAILGQCEQDLSALSALYGGIMPAAASLPFQVSLVPGGGGASHPGCLATAITCYINAGSLVQGIPLLVDAEVAEVFMATQGQGVNCGYSNGEAFSRMLPTVLYPALRNLFSTGNTWLNSTNPSRPDWVTSTEPTDQDLVSVGCGSLFLNYLAYQLNFAWPDIVRAGAPTLGQTAATLGLQNAFADFAALLARHFPPGTPVNLLDDNPFPLLDPSLYIRHNLADDGTSHTGPLSESPDIIVKNNPVASPQATYSTPASIGSDHESDPAVLAGTPNYVYLRVWNRGTDATSVTATAYWSPPATLVAPGMWNLIGSTEFADVPPGRVVQVSDPGITWAQADIPAPGHYCFVATAGNADDPEPRPAAFASFDEFVAYIYAHNNISWRNFNVVPLVRHKIGEPFPEFVELRFLIAGAWDAAHAFALESIADLPVGSRLDVQVPRWIGRGLRPPHPDRDADDENGHAEPGDRPPMRLHLDPHGRHVLGEVDVPADTAAVSHLLVHVPAEHRDRAHDVAIRQLYAGREVGRITWRLVPERSLPAG
jgi:hypothetical protein